MNIRTLLQTKLINILNIHTNPDFKFLAECTEWVHQKLVSLTNKVTNFNFFLFSLLLTTKTTNLRIRRIQDRSVLMSQRVPVKEDLVELSITNTKSTRTVIEMTAIQTNPNFKQIQECIDIVTRQLVSENSYTVPLNRKMGLESRGFFFTSETSEKTSSSILRQGGGFLSQYARKRNF